MRVVVEYGGSIRSLSRGLAVLQAINRAGSLTMTDISRLSDLPYGTAYRLVQALINDGFLEAEPARRHYRPTALVQTLAHGFQGDGRLVRAARPHIVELTKTSAWPITLSTHVGHSMVIRDSTHSISPLTFSEYFPGYATFILESAAGLSNVAFMAEPERDDLMAGLKLLQNARWTHMIQLIEETSMLEGIRACGYASRGYNQFTRNPGKTSSIAVPLLENGQVAGAISLAFFSSSIQMKEAIANFTPALLEVARAIEQDLIERPA